MEERKIIEDRLRKKEHEIEILEDRLRTARVYVQALQDILKLLNSDENGVSGSVLRAGSAVAQARQIILDRGEPVHVSAILEAMGKDANRETRASLTSSLAAYVRRGEIFTRPAPNTFGLGELGHATDDRIEEPPEGFGRVPNVEQAPVPKPSVVAAAASVSISAAPRPPAAAPKSTAPISRPLPPRPSPPPPPPADDVDDDIPF